MASKRMKNRLYWLTAKSHGSIRGIWIERAYVEALNGAPDSKLIERVELWEAMLNYGAHRPSVDLHDESLWLGRRAADQVKAEATRYTVATEGSRYWVEDTVTNSPVSEVLGTFDEARNHCRLRNGVAS